MFVCVVFNPPKIEVVSIVCDSSVLFCFFTDDGVSSCSDGDGCNGRAGSYGTAFTTWV